MEALGIVMLLIFVIVLVKMGIDALTTPKAGAPPPGWRPDDANDGEVDDEPATGVAAVSREVVATLKLVRQLLIQLSLSDERRRALAAQLTTLETRARNDVLNLAVVGEFNAGKSTFINALVRRPILKAASVAATAKVASLSFGETPRLEVRFVDGSTVAATEGDFGTLRARFQRHLAPAAACNFERLVALATSDPEASQLVASCDLQLPSPSLRRGMSILDTPGIGAGSDYAGDHESVTAAVVGERADVAIVLIPAQAAASQTLLHFLSTTLQPFLTRCVFVITQVDRLDEEERAEVRRFVALKLAPLCGRTAVIREVAALAMMPSIPPELAASRDTWRAEFERLESFVLDEMSRQRSLIIAENLLRLSREIATSVDGEIESQLRGMQEESRVLAENSVPVLRKVVESLERRCSQEINVQLKAMKQTLADKTVEFEVRLKTRTEELLNCNKFAELKAAVSSGIPGAVFAHESVFDDELAETFAALDARCHTLHQWFASEFEKHYQQLKALGFTQSPKDGVATLASGSRPPVFARGTTPLPDLGIGAWVNFFFDPAGQRRTLREKIFPVVDQHVERCRAVWDGRVLAAGEAATSSMNRLAKAHLERYEKKVREMAEEHKRRVEAVELKRQKLEYGGAKLKQRSARLAALKESLTAVEQGEQAIRAQSAATA